MNDPANSRPRASKIITDAAAILHRKFFLPLIWMRTAAEYPMKSALTIGKIKAQGKKMTVTAISSIDKDTAAHTETKHSLDLFSCISSISATDKIKTEITVHANMTTVMGIRASGCTPKSPRSFPAPFEAEDNAFSKKSAIGSFLHLLYRFVKIRKTSFCDHLIFQSFISYPFGQLGEDPHIASHWLEFLHSRIADIF